MDTSYEALLRRLYQGDRALSRNRNFWLYEQPAMRRAARSFRRLKSVERDLLRYGPQGQVTVEVVGDSSWLRVVIASPNYRRVTRLSWAEVTLLHEHPGLKGVLPEPALGLGA